MDETLTLYIDDLREGPVRMTRTISPGDLDLSDEEYRFDDVVEADVTFRLIGETDVLATGTLKTRAGSVCVRCLEPARVDLDCQVAETWIKGHPGNEATGDDIEEAPLLRGYTGDSFDVSDVFRELVMAELPSHPVCRPDCRGLCPGCGVNLNVEPCQCVADGQEASTGPVEPEWKQSLKKLHPDK